ncbi:head decoration protein [[Pseudomonas] boreopolis]|uniref:Head decoration protein n=1 Tax=Xanthomonas boreopolis TaxID=86183 RepID=A0A919KIE1_9XANT|nr:hypothetical protein GCM10009090_16560 [[Pseudomonas] boreopolis]
MEISRAGVRNAEFLLSEANGERSRELIYIPTGQGILPAGTLLKADNTKAVDGAEAVKLLYGQVDTGTAAGGLAVKGTAIARDAEVHGELLGWASDTTSDEKLLAAISLEESGIVVRWTNRPIASNTAHHIVFRQVPLMGEANEPIGPVIAEIRDVFGALVNGSAASVTLAKSAGAGDLAGGGAKAAVNGVVTWDEISFSAADTYTLTATAADLTAAVSDNIVISAAA